MAVIYYPKFTVSASNSSSSSSSSVPAEVITLVDAEIITPDFTQGRNFTVTLSGNRTLGFPASTVVGQTGSLFFVQDDVGNRTLTVGSGYNFSDGRGLYEFGSYPQTINMVDYFIKSETSIYLTRVTRYMYDSITDGETITDIPNLVTWFDSSINFVDDGTGKASSWTSKAADGAAVSQASSSMRPTIVTGELNGYPVMRFTRSASSCLTASNTILTGASARTVFLVFKGFTGTTIGSYAFGFFMGGGGTLQQWAVGQVDSSSNFASSFYGTNVASTYPLDNSAIIYRGVYSNPGFVSYINGGYSGSNESLSLNIGATEFTFGGCLHQSCFANIDIAEFILFSRALTESEMDEVESYLAAKYDIGLSG